MTWLDKLKKRKGPPQWPKEEAIDHGIEQLTKLMPKGSRAVDAEKRGKMREKFNEAIHPHWHKTEGVDWDKVVKDALAYATGGPLAPVPAPAAPVPAPAALAPVPAPQPKKHKKRTDADYLARLAEAAAPLAPAPKPTPAPAPHNPNECLVCRADYMEWDKKTTCVNCKNTCHFDDDVTGCGTMECLGCAGQTCKTCWRACGATKLKPYCSKKCKDPQDALYLESRQGVKYVPA